MWTYFQIESLDVVLAPHISIPRPVNFLITFTPMRLRSFWSAWSTATSVSIAPTTDSLVGAF